jgi:hypothetical protein
MNIFLQALVWQFFDAPKEILKGWRNFLLFNLNYFSIPILLRTFISPWRRYSYSYGKIFEIWNNIQVFVFNIMSRVIGAVLRSVFIIIGILVEILIIIVGAIMFIGWILLPILLLAGFLFGLRLIFY